MAVDEALMEFGRTGRVAIRFYTWEPPCLSLGRNQVTGDRLAGRRREEFAPGEDIVRRPTAGRSVYHGPELTYAVVAPERLWGGPREIYRRVHGAVASALAGLGIRLDEGVGRPGGPLALDGEACFSVPAPGELTVGGRKLVGSAQWRHRGAVLQHGSILLKNEQSRASLSPISGGRVGGAIGLDELGLVSGSLPLAASIVKALAGVAGHEPRAAVFPDDVKSLADRLEPRYRSEAWTWRR